MVKYKVNVEFRSMYKDGRLRKRPIFRKETTIWDSKKVRNYKGHLEAVYGKNNVRNFRIKRVLKIRRL